jgi:transposase-like protein
MPWKQVGMSEQRIEFAVEGRKPDANIAELCRAHGISRQTGYTWLRRYQQEGAMGGDWGTESTAPPQPETSGWRSGGGIEGGARGTAGLGSAEIGGSA